MHSHVLVDHSVIFGGTIHKEKVLETSIGRQCRVRNAILDRNVTLREGTMIGYDRADDERRGLKTHPIAGSSDYLVVAARDMVL